MALGGRAAEAIVFRRISTGKIMVAMVTTKITFFFIH